MPSTILTPLAAASSCGVIWHDGRYTTAAVSDSKMQQATADDSSPVSSASGKPALGVNH